MKLRRLVYLLPLLLLLNACSHAPKKVQVKEMKDDPSAPHSARGL